LVDVGCHSVQVPFFGLPVIQTRTLAALFPLSRIESVRLETRFSPLPPVPDHPALEREILALWEDDGTFFKLRDRNRGGPTFSFMDGPITANNPMGVHHAW